MNILIFSPSKYPTTNHQHGGACRSIYEIALGLYELGHNISLICGKGSQADFCKHIIEVDKQERGAGLAVTLGIEKSDPDVILDSSQYISTSEIFDVPRINRICGGNFGGKITNNVVVNSQFMQQKYGGKLIQTMIRGDLHQHFSPQNYEWCIYGSRKFAIKGWNIVQQLINKGLNIKVVNDLSGDEYLKMVSQAKYLIHPSIVDAAPRTPLEAALVGTPTLCINEGGSPEQVYQNNTGYTCKSIDELERRIKEPRTLNGFKIRKHILENRSYEKMIQDYETLLIAAANGEKW